MAETNDSGSRDAPVSGQAQTGAATASPGSTPPKTRQQFLPTHMMFEGKGYGPGPATVPENFPRWPEGSEEAAMDKEATLLSEYERNRDEFTKWMAERTQGATNDAGLAQPESGEPGVANFGTATGSNHGVQTGVVEKDTVPANAAGNRDGDRLSEKTLGTAPAATGVNTATGVRTSTSTAKNTTQR